MRVMLFGQSGQVGEAILKTERNDIEWVCPERSLAEGDLLYPRYPRHHQEKKHSRPIKTHEW